MADEPRGDAARPMKIWIQVTDEHLAAVHPFDMQPLLAKDPQRAGELIAEELKRLREP